MTHCDIVVLVDESKPFEIRLKQCIWQFSTGIHKCSSDVLKTVFNVAQRNAFVSTVIIMWKYMVCMMMI